MVTEEIIMWTSYALVRGRSGLGLSVLLSGSVGTPH